MKISNFSLKWTSFEKKTYKAVKRSVGSRIFFCFQIDLREAFTLGGATAVCHTDAIIFSLIKAHFCHFDKSIKIFPVPRQSDGASLRINL
jgi:hypothetical protein